MKMNNDYRIKGEIKIVRFIDHTKWNEFYIELVYFQNNINVRFEYLNALNGTHGRNCIKTFRICIVTNLYLHDIEYAFHVINQNNKISPPK